MGVFVNSVLDSLLPFYLVIPCSLIKLYVWATRATLHCSRSPWPPHIYIVKNLNMHHRLNPVKRFWLLLDFFLGKLRNPHVEGLDPTRIWCIDLDSGSGSVLGPTSTPHDFFHSLISFSLGRTRQTQKTGSVQLGLKTAKRLALIEAIWVVNVLDFITWCMVQTWVLNRPLPLM